jgi:DNA-binding NarL/FixJ family response regulator
VNVDGLSILLVEDDAMVTGWVRVALEGSNIRLAGVAASAAEAVALAERRHVDVFLIDYRLPDGRGTELVRSLRQGGIRAPAILMTANAEPGFNPAAREAGAQGTVLKTGSAVELVDALTRVHAGDVAFDPRHPERKAGRAALSPRERQVISLVAKGSTNQQIAEQLGVGSETVKTLLARTFSKLGVRRRAEAVSAAHDLGLL